MYPILNFSFSDYTNFLPNPHKKYVTRLNTVLVNGESGNGKVKVTVTANREIRSINISDDLLNEKDELEDYLIIALNNALNNANEINETEMAAAAKDGMPDIPGLDMFK